MIPNQHGPQPLRRHSRRRRRSATLLIAGCCAAAAGAMLPAPLARAADPSNDEQYMLELLNRMRMNPAAELHKLVNISGNPATFLQMSAASLSRGIPFFSSPS